MRSSGCAPAPQTFHDTLAPRQFGKEDRAHSSDRPGNGNPSAHRQDKTRLIPYEYAGTDPGTRAALANRVEHAADLSH